MTNIGTVPCLDQVHVYVDTGYFTTTMRTAAIISNTAMISYRAKFMSTRAKLKILVQISISLFLKSYGRPYGEFSEPGFLHNFVTKKDRQDLNTGCVDAPRRHLQSVIKIGV